MFQPSDLLLVLASFFAGALNSVAGGGSFLTFPTLLFCGVPPLVANASNTVALFPGSFTAAWAYRRELGTVTEIKLWQCLSVSLVGGIMGALLLLKTPESAFVFLIPYLLLFATVLFAFGGRVAEALKKRAAIPLAAVLAGQFVVAVYGGYFGAGVGILTLAMLGILGMRNIHAMNAVKSLLVGGLNGIAVVLFVSAGAINWRVSVIMMAGAMVGGFAGASTARKISQPVLKKFVCLVGLALSVYYFVK